MLLENLDEIINRHFFTQKLTYIFIIKTPFFHKALEA